MTAWRLYSQRVTERWSSPLVTDSGALEGGLELPAGARVHSIVPAVTRHAPADSYTGAPQLEEVLEWVVFYVMPEPEEAAGGA